MEIDLLGRIKNVQLPFSKVLYPLYEAIINSIDAIDEKDEKDGIIAVKIERDDSQTELEITDEDLRPIKSITVIDNGIGFTDRNYKSFLKSDTTLKIAKGAKGIGRFLWLKAFEKVRIESIYEENGKFFNRSFDFVLSEQGVENHQKSETSIRKRKTTVKLINFKHEYRIHCPTKLETIASRTIEHILNYFLFDSCPQIKIGDDDKGLLLNDI
jgi:hypothetical protein